MKDKGFVTDATCPYFSDGHTWAKLNYANDGQLLNVKGPGGGTYGHVIGFTH